MEIGVTRCGKRGRGGHRCGYDIVDWINLYHVVV
jgi:hypothetical protein